MEAKNPPNWKNKSSKFFPNLPRLASILIFPRCKIYPSIPCCLCHLGHQHGEKNECHATPPGDTWPIQKITDILLMEEILHHLGYIYKTHIYNATFTMSTSDLRISEPSTISTTNQWWINIRKWTCEPEVALGDAGAGLPETWEALYVWLHQKLNGTESWRTPKLLELLETQVFLGVCSVGPVGDVLEWKKSLIQQVYSAVCWCLLVYVYILYHCIIVQVHVPSKRPTEAGTSNKIMLLDTIGIGLNKHVDSCVFCQLGLLSAVSMDLQFSLTLILHCCCQESYSSSTCMLALHAQGRFRMPSCPFTLRFYTEY